MADNPQHEFRLGAWQVKPLRGIVVGDEGSRRITPKAMDVLLTLVRNAGEVVDRDTFLKEVWDGRAFGDDPLNKCIAELRRELGDRGPTRQYIETIPKRGYRLIAEVEPVGETLSETATAARPGRLRMIALGVLSVLAVIGAWQLTTNMLPDGNIAVAVLPIRHPDDPDQQYFADGIHEALIAELSRADSLTIRPRTSTLPYRASNTPLDEVAAALQADVIVVGSVYRHEDNVRVTAELIQASNDRNLWADSIERSLTVESLFAIQSEIATEIADALKVTLAGGGARPLVGLPTASVEAYEAFMLGKFHYRRQLPGDIRESVNRFEQAVALDPAFADAWDWLAYAYNHAATGVGHLTPDEAYPKARAAALRALELRPDLATALSILGYIRAVHDRDWVGALNDLERALELDPDDSGTVWSLAHVYSMLGRHEEAIRLTQEFAERHPERGRNHLEVANRLFDAGDYTAVLRQLDVAAGNGAEAAQIADLRGATLVALGRFEDALPILEFAVDAQQRSAGTLGRLAYAYGRSDRLDDARRLVEELESRSTTDRVPLLSLATAHLGAGSTDIAIGYIRQAVDAGGREVIGLKSDPFFAEIAENPDFLTEIQRLNTP